MSTEGLEFSPLIPLSVWWGLAVAGLVVLVWYARRRPASISPLRWGSIIVLMGIGGALPLLLELNPTWVRALPQPAGKPQLTVLVDATGSMGTADVENQSTRFTAAAGMAKTIQERLSDQFDVRLQAFSDNTIEASTTSLVALTPGGRSTDLAGALQASLDSSREQGQAVVLLSDGAHNASGGVGRIFDVVRLAKSMDTPVYTYTLGGARRSLDLAVEMRTPQDLAFVGQKVPVIARVYDAGVNRGTAEVLLLEGGREVARQSVPLVAGGSSEAKFWIKRDVTGMFPYEIRVMPFAGETSQTNNVADYLLRVIDKPVKVLLLEGKPYWDTKFLVRTLSSVPAVELDSVVRLSDNRLIRRTWKRQANDEARATTMPSVVKRDQEFTISTSAKSFLSNPETLKNIQVVVLGRDAEAFLDETAIENLQRWVARDGGSLLCFRGAPAAEINGRLARLLPVQWEKSAESRFHLQLTDQGRDMNWLPNEGESAALAAMPSLAMGMRVAKTAPLAVVLASMSGPTGDAAPAVIYQPYGTGRTVVIEGAGMWRWAFLPPQYKDREETYDMLWHSILRWIASGVALMPGQNMMLRVDKISFDLGENATATVVVRDTAGKAHVPDVTLTDLQQNDTQTFTPAPFGSSPGTYRVAFGKLPEGRYQVQLVGGDAKDAVTRSVFDVRNVSAEMMDVQARPDLMRRIAESTSGNALGSDPAGQIRAEFNKYRDASRPTQYLRSSAWDRWWIFAAMIATWALAWGLRRSGGLI